MKELLATFLPLRLTVSSVDSIIAALAESNGRAIMNSSLAKTGLKALLSKKSLPPKNLRLVSLRLLPNLALMSTAHPFLKLKTARPTI